MILMEKSNLEEWQKSGGKGIIDYNVPGRKESFTYKQRKKNILYEISGIKNPHPVGADVRTGILGKIPNIGGDFTIKSECNLFGASNALAGGTDTIFGAGHIFFPAQKEVYCRFYALFKRPKLIHDRRQEKASAGFYFFGLYNKQKTGRIRFMKLWLKDVLTDNPFPELSFYTADKGQVKIPVAHTLQWNIPYCFTVFSKVGKKQGCGLKLFLNGNEIYSDLNYDISQIQAVDYAKLKMHSLTGLTLLSPVMYDEVVISKDYPGRIPPNPYNIEIDTLIHLQPYPSILSRQGIISYQMQISCDNVWLNPLFNSGEMDFISKSGIPFPNNLLSESTYFLRIRLKNNYSLWGPFSRPFRFNGIQSSSIPDGIKTTIISRKDAGKNETALYQAGSYYLSVIPFDTAKIAHMNIWFHSSSFTLGNALNKGGPYIPEKNMIFVLDLENQSLIGRDSKSRQLSVRSNGKLGEYIDDRGNFFIANLKKGLVSLKFRMHESAEKGPWFLNIHAKNSLGEPYTHYKKMFFMQEEEKGFNRWYLLSLFPLLLLVLIFYIKTRRKTPIALSREAALVKKAENYLYQNYANIESVKEISNEIGLSHNYVNKLFKNIAGVSLVEYLLKYRISQAQKLLLNTNLNITEILANVGLSDLSNFNKKFKELTDCSPSQYRKKYKK
jgi:AraC-like DNA-binding protein